MVSSLKLIGLNSNSEMNGDSITCDQDEEFLESDSDDWQVIGPKKKSCVTRTTAFTSSPISEIFWGQLRSIQHQSGGNTTANLQPFTTLPLDIQVNCPCCQSKVNPACVKCQVYAGSKKTSLERRRISLIYFFLG